MYQALYRKWRSRTFSEMVGQEAVIRTLRHQVASGRIAHAYLFCGTRGTGKTTASKVLSRAINCLDPHDGEPCGACEVCRAILSESCMDVLEIDAASNNGVDEIRDLREKVQYPPSMTRYKVYIIDEVHMLSTSAFNALLKTLEEPPAHAVFILATTEPQRLPATILSRCQRFDFHRIAAATIVDRLKVVLQGIGRGAEEEALLEIARAAEGGMRDALSLLDNCLSYTDGDVTLQLARDVLGSAGRGFLFDFADALIDFDVPRAMGLIEEMMDRGSDPTVFARDVTAHLRALLLTPMRADASAFLEVTQEDAERFNEQAKRVSVERLTRLMELFIRAENDMKWASRPRTVLELSAVRACRPEEEPEASLTERMEKLETLLKNGAVVSRPTQAAARKGEGEEKPPAKREAKAEKAKGPAAKPPQAYLDAVARLENEIVSKKSFFGKMVFTGWKDGELTVEFDKKDKIVLSILEKIKDQMEAVFTECFGEPVHLLMRMEGTAAPAAKPGAVSPTARKVINDSYEIFGRENIDLTD